MSDDSSLSKSWHELNFRVQVSIRYHTRRAVFFGNIHRAVKFFSILSATAAAAAVAKSIENVSTEIVLVSAAVISAVNALDLLIGFSTMEAKHFGLRNSFIGVQELMVGKPSQQAYEDGMRQVLRIEKEEPAIFQALHLDVINETLLATKTREVAKEHWEPIGRWQAFTRHFFRWQGI